MTPKSTVNEALYKGTFTESLDKWIYIMSMQFYTAIALKKVLGQKKKSTSVETHSIILLYIPAARSVTKKAYILFTHQQMHFLLNLEKFKFTWKYT